MCASLYDDLDDVKQTVGSAMGSSANKKPAPNVGLRVTGDWADENAKKNTASSFKMMQSHIAARKAQGKRPSDVVPQNNIAPVLDVGGRGEGSFRFNQRTGKMERVSYGSSLASTQQKTLYGEPDLPLGVEDEYNPLLPNEYEEVARLKRERRRQEQEIAMHNNPSRRQSDSQLSDGEGAHNTSSSGESSDEGDDYDQEARRRNDPSSRTSASGGSRRGRAEKIASGANVAIAPPPSLVASDANVAVPPPDLSGPAQVNSVFNNNNNSREDAKQSKFGINQVAAKMMARMGYREGQGLGREGQGMSTALQVEKTGRRAGKIIHERDRPKPGQVEVLQPAPLVADIDDVDGIVLDPVGDSESPSAPVPTASVNPAAASQRSNVILLQNMCGPGEVDDELEPETAEECAKYGQVKSCMIFEVPHTKEDEAVRIFVEFFHTDSALRAINDLNGRYFGGRIVKAGFYDAIKFQNLDLSDPILT